MHPKVWNCKAFPCQLSISILIGIKLKHASVVLFRICFNWMLCIQIEISS